MSHVTRVRVEPADMDNAVKRYIEGEGTTVSIAKSIGISDSALKTELRRRGVPLRTISDGQRLRAARNPSHMTALLKIGHAAIRGKPKSEEYLIRRAQTFHAKQTKLCPPNALFADMLARRGITTETEFAAGRYNIDIAAAPVAVEIHVGPGNPLGSGTSSRRNRNRTRYLCQSGWIVVYVWVNRRGFLNEGSADYVTALLELAKSDPSVVGQYRVIRGSGELVSEGRPDGDEWS